MITRRATVQQVPAPRPLVLSIDRLVLDGLSFSAAQGAHVRVALEQEFARLWSEHEARASRGEMTRGGFVAARMTAPPVSTTASTSAVTSPQHLGRDAARSLFSMLRSE